MITFFEQDQNTKLIEKLKANAVNMTEEKPKEEQIFTGMSFVFTGGLSKLTRQEAEEKIESRGGRASSSVSAKTDYVVIGENPGSKYSKAKKLGVKVIDEKEFLELIGEKTS